MKLAALVAFLISVSSFGIPELIRYNYVNCTSCHVSPNGGGLLSPYGRVLAGEVMSTWSTETEGQFLWGLVQTPESVQLGGDVRFLQTYLNNDFVKTANFITMQADAEAGVTVDKFTFVGTLGKSDAKNPKNIGDALVSHRHFVMYRPAEAFAVRFGRFQKTFGINTPDHVIITKKGLGWDQNTETYNLEGSYLGDEWDLFLTGVFGRPDNSDLIRDRGVAVRGGYNVSESAKVGVSYFYADNKQAKRHVFGPYAMIGFTKKLFLLTEIDFQSNRPNGRASQFGWVNYQKFGYEPVKGLQVYLNHEYGKLDASSPLTETHGYGLGVQWFPRPHFELSALIQKQKIQAMSPNYGDFGWFIFHYYL